MNDRFKFRAWDIKKRCMRTDICISFNGELFIDYDNPMELVYQKPEDFILMQCTGLQDKNGKLIYEGDIIELLGGARGIGLYKVSWSPAEFYFESLDKENFDKEIAWCIGAEKEIMVLGNVYENAELLEKGKSE